jgi:hypothetical protein
MNSLFNNRKPKKRKMLRERKGGNALSIGEKIGITADIFISILTNKKSKLFKEIKGKNLNSISNKIILQM